MELLQADDRKNDHVNNRTDDGNWDHVTYSADVENDNITNMATQVINPVDNQQNSVCSDNCCCGDSNCPTENEQCEIQSRKKVFERRFVAAFMAKRKKYRKTLEEYGGSACVTDTEQSMEGPFETSFNDDVEIVLSENKRNVSVVCGKRTHYSISGLFLHIYHILRRTKASRISSKLQYISEHDVMETLRHVASQLSSAYEYQILMVSDEGQVRKMADHAVSCIISYLKGKQSHFHTGSLLQAVIEITPKIHFSEETHLKTRTLPSSDTNCKNPRNAVWKVQDVFKQPGLRVYQQESGSYKFYGCFTPFGMKCNPQKYGFRDPLYEWDEGKSTYTMVYRDQVTCHDSHKRELPALQNDPRYTYKPYSAKEQSFALHSSRTETDNLEIQNGDDNKNIL